MNDEHISHFETLMSDQFMRVVKHDWWQRYPLDDIDLRVELELWLCADRSQQSSTIVKIHCFYALQTTQESLFDRFERPLRLGVKSIRERHLEEQVYAFFDRDTGSELFTCKWFDAWLASSE